MRGAICPHRGSPQVTTAYRSIGHVGGTRSPGAGPDASERLVPRSAAEAGRPRRPGPGRTTVTAILAAERIAALRSSFRVSSAQTSFRCRPRRADDAQELPLTWAFGSLGLPRPDLA